MGLRSAQRSAGGDAEAALSTQLWDLTLFLQRDFMKKKVIWNKQTFEVLSLCACACAGARAGGGGGMPLGGRQSPSGGAT